MRTIVVVSAPTDWPLEIPGVEVVLARDYLTDSDWVRQKGVRAYNLSRSYRYQSEGYYVSLLAAARRHRPFPDLMTILDMKSRAFVRTVDEELDSVIQESLADIRSERFELSVYFGSNVAKRHSRLARSLYSRFPSPLIRASFQRRDRWRLNSLSPIAFRDVPEDHLESLHAAAGEHFRRPRFLSRTVRESRYDLAILHDPEEELAPSDPKALERFRAAAEKVGLGVEMIGRGDYARLGEFDALFIRETTAVNHHTFRFAHRAEAEGLVVIDDPQSILRCTNKVYQTEALSLQGVPIPETLITDRIDAAQVAERIGFPCVLKVPDSAFSQGVVKCGDEAELHSVGERFLERTELILIQEYMPSEFDWRIGVFGGKALYACRYMMARGHWQIMKKGESGRYRYGRTETLPVKDAPARVVQTALRAAATIGDGLYGVDLKQVKGRIVVTEVNDNPSLDHGYEDAVLKNDLYRVIMEGFLARIEKAEGDHVTVAPPLSLFEGYGIEIESMIVDAETLDPRPIADELLRDASGTGSWVEDHEDGDIAWSNELVTHVVELKTNGPARSFAGLAERFRESGARLQRLLAPHRARLMPGAMHPWMDPARDTRIWPHESAPIYRAYDRLYDCRRHGWANLQSVHLNLPFRGDEEFGRLMAAVRIALPLIPALAASSPIVEGRVTGALDSRLGYYRTNAVRTPAMAGSVIPEPLFTPDSYRREVFGAIDRELTGIGADEFMIGQEWTNARGAIARFDRMAIEIRLIDAQECALADLAVAAAVAGLVRALVEGRFASTELQREMPTAQLLVLLERTSELGPAAELGDAAYAGLFGPGGGGARTAGDLLRRVLPASFPDAPELEEPVELLLSEGTLAQRILRATGERPDRALLREVYGVLCDCLAAGRLFRP